MPGVVDKVAEYCWSNNFLDIFRNYFRDNAAAFIDAPEILSGEHNLEYYALFQKYLKVYENSLTTYVESLGYSISDFYAEVAEIQVDDNTDPHMKLFIDCLLASMDYESFYKVMVKEGKKVKPGLCDPKNVGLDATAGDKDSGSRPGSNIRSCKEYVSPEAKMGGDNQNDADDAKEAKGSRGSGSK